MFLLRSYTDLQVNRSVTAVLFKPSQACVIWVIRCSEAAIIKHNKFLLRERIIMQPTNLLPNTGQLTHPDEALGQLWTFLLLIRSRFLKGLKCLKHVYPCPAPAGTYVLQHIMQRDRLDSFKMSKEITNFLSPQKFQEEFWCWRTGQVKEADAKSWPFTSATSASM